jgi:hypothetical protein
MLKLKEQIATHSYGSRQPKPDDTIYITDEPIEEDDSLYHTRMPSSVRCYRKTPPTSAQTRVHMRVTHHQGVPQTQRASLKAQHQPQLQQKPVKPAQPVPEHKHWLFYVGSTVLVGTALWIVGSSAFSWLSSEHDAMVYGTPRTFQVDQDVQHGGISHFICENLHGNIVVIEVDQSNPSASHLYQGPQFTGAGTDDYIATLSFKNLGNGKPDMIIAVNNQRYVLVNDGKVFRPEIPSDHINEQEVN